jgi:hypothetical protein
MKLSIAFPSKKDILSSAEMITCSRCRRLMLTLLRKLHPNRLMKYTSKPCSSTLTSCTHRMGQDGAGLGQFRSMWKTSKTARSRAVQGPEGWLDELGGDSVGIRSRLLSSLHCASSVAPRRTNGLFSLMTAKRGWRSVQSSFHTLPSNTTLNIIRE